MIEVYSDSKSDTAIVTLAVGDSYIDTWKNHAYPNWIDYCERNSINLFVVDESLDESPTAKKTTWQKLLIPSILKRNFPRIRTFCYLDSDIAINPLGESIFNVINSNTVNLVSQFRNLPFPLFHSQKMVSFHRNRFYSSQYPLDSSIFMQPTEIFQHHNLPLFYDYACMGLIAGSVDILANEFEDIYHSYDSSVYSITGGGDEPLLNFELASRYDINWLEYKFQALWLFEMAYNFPFLYYDSQITDNLIMQCVDVVLQRNVFLHFAGSWGESKMIRFGPFMRDQEYFTNLMQYLKSDVKGKPVGLIRPK